MGSILRDSDRCRFCASQVSELKFGLYTDSLSVLRSDENGQHQHTSISFTHAAKELLNLKLDAESGFSQVSCHSCKTSLENFSNFLHKVNVGQNNLLEIMKSEGSLLIKKKGRPKKGSEKRSPIQNDENLIISGKRVKRTTKKFEEFESSHKNDEEFLKSNAMSSILKQMKDDDGGGDAKRLGVYNCDACNKVFRVQEDLDWHISSSHGQIMYKCERCSSTLKDKEELKSHQVTSGHEDFIILEIAGGQDPSKLEGNQCDKSSSQLEEVRIFSCDHTDCDRKFSSSNSLAYHRTTAHNTVSLVCPQTDCGKLFKSKNLLNRHLKTHSSERSYNCDKCDKSFKTRSNLHSHLNVHNSESKFFCEECGQQFKHRTSLAAHKRWHAGERPFKCPFCVKSFNQKGNLQEHIR